MSLTPHYHSRVMFCVGPQAFNGMAKRAPLKKAMAHHELGLFIALDAENAALARALEQIRKDLQLPRSAAQPRFAGAAAAAARLTRRATATWDAMQVSVSPLVLHHHFHGAIFQLHTVSAGLTYI